MLKFGHPDFHFGNTGSIPVGDVSMKSRGYSFFGSNPFLLWDRLGTDVYPDSCRQEIVFSFWLKVPRARTFNLAWSRPMGVLVPYYPLLSKTLGSACLRKSQDLQYVAH